MAVAYTRQSAWAGARATACLKLLASLLAVSLCLACCAQMSSAAPVTIFTDDFEVAFAGWTLGGTPDWYVGSPMNGTHSIRLRKTDSITKTVDTSGHTSITVSFYLGAFSLDNAAENVQALWYDGATWRILKQINDGDPEEDKKLHYFQYSLPSGASDNSAFALRFVVNGDATNDYGYVDDVLVQGEPIPYTLSLSGSGGLVNVEGSPQSLPWSGSFDYGSVVSLEAIADPGYEFDSWSGDLSGSANPTTIRINKDKNISASFAAHDLSVTADASPSTVASGGSSDLTASASDSRGHSIASWAWNDGGAGGSFAPSASVQNPTYTAPANLGESDLYITLTVQATCDGPSPLTAEGAVTLTVTPGSTGSCEVVAMSLPPALTWDQTGDASITYRNLDDHDWAVGEGYQLLPLDGMDRWAMPAIPIEQTVSPDSTYAFGFSLTAPPITTLVYPTPVEEITPATPQGLPAGGTMSRGSVPLSGGDASGDVLISRFPDTRPGTSGAWAVFQIEECAGRVPFIVTGYREPDGTYTYRPTIEVNRAAMAVYMARALKLDLLPYQGIFPDVDSGFWAVQQIEALYRKGYVVGFGDGTYRPANIVKRDAMAVYVARGMAGGDANVPPGPPTPTFTDVLGGFWAYDYIEYAVAHHVVVGYSDHTYRPSQPVNRGQMAVYIYRGLIQPVGSPVVLGGPAITAVDPATADYWGWTSAASPSAADPGYAYVVLDAVRLGTNLAADDGYCSVVFSLEGPTTVSQEMLLSADDITTAKAEAMAAGWPYCAVYWDIPGGLPTGDYTLKVSIEDETGRLNTVSRQPVYSFNP